MEDHNPGRPPAPTHLFFRLRAPTVEPWSLAALSERYRLRQLGQPEEVSILDLARETALSLIPEPNSRQSVRCKSRKKASPQLATRLIMTSPFYHICIPRQAIGALAMLTLCGILVAGLWPFHSPKNQVHWLDNENGLRFGDYGTILSSGMFESASSDGPSCSLEIWLEPALPWNGGTVVAFYSPSPRRQFSLQQSHYDLALQRDFEDLHHQGQLARMYVDEVFRKKRLFVTVTSDGLNTAVYIDGRLATRSLRFGLSLEDLTGELIIANSPLQNNSWSGQLRGLAIYRSELNAAQVAQHYED